MKKQTPVDWLIEQLTPLISLQQKHIDDLKEKAKQMEKNQIIKAFTRGYLIGEDESFPIEAAHKAGQKYYDEIIKTK
jgi:predicted secreted protein